LFVSPGDAEQRQFFQAVVNVRRETTGRNGCAAQEAGRLSRAGGV
jgi:hypothetical protein